jgi:hypothetical protein
MLDPTDRTPGPGLATPKRSRGVAIAQVTTNDGVTDTRPVSYLTNSHVTGIFPVMSDTTLLSSGQVDASPRPSVRMSPPIVVSRGGRRRQGLLPTLMADAWAGWSRPKRFGR